MNEFERLYDEVEKSQVRYVGFTSETTRYDFAIIYTNLFFGKTLVVDMQLGKSALLSEDDVQNTEYLQSLFQTNEEKETAELADFLQSVLPSSPLKSQY